MKRAKKFDSPPLSWYDLTPFHSPTLTIPSYTILAKKSQLVLSRFDFHEIGSALLPFSPPSYFPTTYFPDIFHLKALLLLRPSALTLIGRGRKRGEEEKWEESCLVHQSKRKWHEKGEGDLLLYVLMLLAYKYPCSTDNAVMGSLIQNFFATISAQRKKRSVTRWHGYREPCMHFSIVGIEEYVTFHNDYLLHALCVLIGSCTG